MYSQPSDTLAQVYCDIDIWRGAQEQMNAENMKTMTTDIIVCAHVCVCMYVYIYVCTCEISACLISGYLFVCMWCVFGVHVCVCVCICMCIWSVRVCVRARANLCAFLLRMDNWKDFNSDVDIKYTSTITTDGVFIFSGLDFI